MTWMSTFAACLISSVTNDPRRISFHRELRDVLGVGDVQHARDRVLVVDHEELSAEVGHQLLELDEPRGRLGLVPLARVDHEEVASGPLGDPRAAPHEVVGGVRLADADQDAFAGLGRAPLRPSRPS